MVKVKTEVLLQFNVKLNFFFEFPSLMETNKHLINNFKEELSINDKGC